MSEHHFYSADAWAAIVQRIPNADPNKIDVVRQRLESAASAYLSEGMIRSDMTDAKGKREKWRRVASVANELREAIDALDEWSPPIWGLVEQNDLEQEARDRDRWIKELERLNYMALEHSWSCDMFVGGNSDRTRLFSQILCIWTDDLHQKLGVTRRENKVRGPLWDFFSAAVSPILRDKTPKPETFAKIVKREKETNNQMLRKNGKAKPKRRSPAPSPMVP